MRGPPCLQPKSRIPEDLGWFSLATNRQPEKPIVSHSVVTCIFTHRPSRSRSHSSPCRPVKSAVLSGELLLEIVVVNSHSQTAHRTSLAQSSKPSTARPLRARCLEPQPCLQVGRNRVRGMRYSGCCRAEYALIVNSLLTMFPGYPTQDGGRPQQEEACPFTSPPYTKSTPRNCPRSQAEPGFTDKAKYHCF